jgi:Transposase IS66 family
VGLEEAITARSRSSWHRHADETSWHVFAPQDGGGPARWWLWVFIAPGHDLLRDGPHPGRRPGQPHSRPGWRRPTRPGTETIGAIDAARITQMAAPGLAEPAKKALATLDREWNELTAHREFPVISLDNNLTERAIRRPVVTRKNAYGSRNDDAALLATRIWTITATAEMAGLDESQSMTHS